jgi:TATA-binding protein-associated factor Taf7
MPGGLPSPILCVLGEPVARRQVAKTPVFLRIYNPDERNSQVKQRAGEKRQQKEGQQEKVEKAKGHDQGGQKQTQQDEKKEEEEEQKQEEEEEEEPQELQKQLSESDEGCVKSVVWDTSMNTNAGIMRTPITSLKFMPLRENVPKVSEFRPHH